MMMQMTTKKQKLENYNQLQNQLCLVNLNKCPRWFPLFPPLTLYSQLIILFLFITRTKLTTQFKEATESFVPEVLNEKAVAVITRVQQKLTGTDFASNNRLTVEEQVAKLIEEATSSENLSQSYFGWCPFW